MKVKSPTSPLSSGADSVELRELRGAVEGEDFAASLSELGGQPGASGAGSPSGAGNPTRAGLEQVAASADLTTSEGAASAVRESACLMVRARLGERYRDTEQVDKLVEELGGYVAADPLLKSKIFSILQKLKTG